MGYHSRNQPPRGPSKSWDDEDHTVITCQQIAEFCLDYVDGALPQDEQIGFRRHLGQCPDCVTFFETYRKTPELSRVAMTQQMPEAVRESVRTYLRGLRDR